MSNLLLEHVCGEKVYLKEHKNIHDKHIGNNFLFV